MTTEQTAQTEAPILTEVQGLVGQQVVRADFFLGQDLDRARRIGDRVMQHQEARPARLALGGIGGVVARNGGAARQYGQGKQGGDRFHIVLLGGVLSFNPAPGARQRGGRANRSA